MHVETGGVYAYCALGSTAECPGIVYGGSLSGSTWSPNHSLIHQQGCFHTTTICCKSTGNLRDPSVRPLPMVEQCITFLAARPQVWGEDTQQMKCAMCTHLRNPNPPSHNLVHTSHLASTGTYAEMLWYQDYQSTQMCDLIPSAHSRKGEQTSRPAK